MADGEINITLRSAGGDKVAAEFGKVGRASKDLIVNVKKIGNVFGELGGNIGGLLQNILKGSIWGIAAEVAKGIGGFIKAKIDENREKLKNYRKAVAQSFENMAQRAKSYEIAIAKVAKAETEAVNASIGIGRSSIPCTPPLERA